jgi:hypothetical protein
VSIAALVEVTAAPLALTALSWLASGVVLGRLFPFPAGWLSYASGAALACAVTGPRACTAAVAASAAVAAAWWYLTARGGRHAGPVAFRPAARRRTP